MDFLKSRVYCTTMFFSHQNFAQKKLSWPSLVHLTVNKNCLKSNESPLFRRLNLAFFQAFVWNNLLQQNYTNDITLTTQYPLWFDYIYNFTANGFVQKKQGAAVLQKRCFLQHTPFNNHFQILSHGRQNVEFNHYGQAVTQKLFQFRKDFIFTDFLRPFEPKLQTLGL